MMVSRGECIKIYDIYITVAKQLRIFLVTKANNDFSQLLAMANLVS